MTGTSIIRVAAIAADILGHFSVPGATLISGELQRLMERRQAAACDILIEELRQGDASLSDARQVSDVVAELYRFSRAAQEGTARLNLRLMAKVIAGQVATGNLYASEFLRYADLIASLSREEIILAACLHRHSISDEIQAMPLSSRQGTIHRKGLDELIPAIFLTEEEFIVAATSLQRTGLVVASSGYGALVYFTSSFMTKISQLASFEDALRQEPV